MHSTDRFRLLDDVLQTHVYRRVLLRLCEGKGNTMTKVMPLKYNDDWASKSVYCRSQLVEECASA